ncbi:enoyl-CoA hydratase-related protein [Cupriavidus basilensis]
MQYEDILYEVRNGAAWITINRPEKMNAFRGRTCDELIHAINRAGYDRAIGAIVLAGAGEKAFCTGGDQSAHEGQYDGRGTIGLPMEELHNAIRDVPKPVIARVQGYAIGGGNVLCTICDFTIASDKAVFGQVGPKVGSVDPGYGTAFLARVVGEKKRARSGTCAGAIRPPKPLPWGWSTPVVPHEQLDAGCRNGATRSWTRARPRWPSPSAPSIWTPPARAASPAWACTREALLRHRGIARGRDGLPGKAQARFPRGTRSNPPLLAQATRPHGASCTGAPCGNTSWRRHEPLSR